MIIGFGNDEIWRIITVLLIVNKIPPIVLFEKIIINRKLKMLNLKFEKIIFVTITTIEVFAYGVFIVGDIFSKSIYDPVSKMICLNIACQAQIMAGLAIFFIAYILIPIKFFLIIINFIKKNFMISSLLGIYISLFNPFTKGIFYSITGKIGEGIHYYIIGGKFSIILLSVALIAFYVFISKESRKVINII